MKGVSRRRLLKQGAAAALGGGAASLLAGDALQAQQVPGTVGGANNIAGRKFRAWVSQIGRAHV